MTAGDTALLYTGGGEFPYYFTVIAKAHAPTLADHLWQRDTDDRPWEYMYFFDRTRGINLDIADVRDALGYKGDWWPQGLQYPVPENQEILAQKFGSVAAFVASVGSAKGGAPPLEQLLLGAEFSGIPPQPPKPPQHRVVHDPDVSGRGYVAHEETVRKLAHHIGSSFRKGTPGVNHDGGWRTGDVFHLAEVKSITPTNDVSQLQRGLGQILHNLYKARQHGAAQVQGYLIAEREPANSALWRDLCAEVGLVFTWPERFTADIATL